MALIKCPECEAEISDQAIRCPKCGCPNVGRGNEATESNKTPTKKYRNIIIVIGTLIVFVIGIACILLLTNRNKPAKEAMEIIMQDLGVNGKELTFDRIYYNENENACVVYYNNGEIDDIAVVLLDSREVGYQIMFELAALGMELANTEEQKQRIAQEIINNPYVPVYVYNVVMGDETWILIYQ